MRGYVEINFAILLCILSLTTVNASHYRGGTIFWSAVDDNPEQVKLTYKLGYKLKHVEPGHDDCLLNTKEPGEILETNGYLKCDECDNGADVKIQDLEYHCTDYDEVGQWARGSNSLVYDAPATSFNVSYESCCWVDLVSHGRGTGRGWKMAAAIDLRRRSDTGRINSSPISETLPVQFMEKGCSYALQIPVLDPDNDDVRCRWPDMEHECNQANNGVCGPTPNARLKKSDCTLRFNTKKMAVGWHAVNLIIEDFASEDSDVPLSKVTLQFLISVLDSATCNKPKVISPSGGSCRTIAAGSQFLMPLIVDVAPGRRLRSFTTLKPEGMTISEIIPIPGEITEFYSTLRWIPTTQQIGKHTLCFQASDNYGSPTAMTCMHLNVMDAESVGTLTAELASPATTDGVKLRFLFSGEIQRPSDRKFIIIRDYHGVEQFKVDASKKKSGVTYEGRILEFGFPPNILSRLDSGYQLVFDAGLAKGTTKCGVQSEPYELNLQQIVLAAGLRRKPPGKYGVKPKKPAAFPQCFASSMTIYVLRKIVGDIDPRRMHLIDPSCRGEMHNETHYVIGTGYGMCGTTFQRGEIKKDETINIMGNIIYLPAAPYTNSSIVTREQNIEIHVNCSITSDYLTSGEFNPEVKTLVYYETGYGHFNFSLKMYANEIFNKYFKHTDFPVDVDLKQRLYFEARSWARDGMQLMLDSCRATPTANPFDEVQYTFIRDGCSIEDTVEMHPIRFPLRKRFSVSAFAFMGHLMENSVFIHCDMRLCDMLDPNSRCARSCVPAVTRHRRDAISDGNSTAAYQDSDGPIRLVQLYEFDETESSLHANADLLQTVMIGIVILLLVTLIIVQLRGITCRSIDQKKDFI